MDADQSRTNLEEPDISALTRIGRRSARVNAYKAALRRDPCAYCKRPALAPNEIDHIEPRALGGADDWTNYAGACRGCNRDKVSMPLLDVLLFGVGAEDMLALPSYYDRHRVSAAWAKCEQILEALDAPGLIPILEIRSLCDQLTAARAAATTLGCSGRKRPAASISLISEGGAT